MIRPAFNTIKLILLLLSLFFLISGCAKDPKPEWKYGEDAITVVYRSAMDLNAVNDRPHSLMLVIYQLKDINEFNRFAGYKEGLRKLLEAKVFDESVMAMKKIYVEPGGARNITLNRAENSRFVGIVAGYYDLVPSRCSAVLDIEYETKRRGLLKIWKNTNINSLGINLVLGRDGIWVRREVDDDS